MSQQFQASKPADQQGRFCRRRLGRRGDRLLSGPFLLERNRGAAVEIRTDVAPAPPDVVCAADQLPLRWRPREPVLGRGALFDDRRDPLVTEIPAEGVLPCFQTKPTSPLKERTSTAQHCSARRAAR